MVDSSVTVGCAVGIPAGVIIIFVLVLWLRNQRLQKRQDVELKSLDEEIQGDNALYADMEHELVAIRPPGAPPKESTGAAAATSKELRPPFDEKLKLLAIEVTSDIQDTSSLLAADQTPSTGAVDSPAPKNIDLRSITTATSDSVTATTAPTTPIQPRRHGHSHSNSNSNSTMAGQSQRTPSLYSFYDLVIPVMAQPGPIGAGAPNSAPLPKNGSSASLGNAAPSLENLAKQLAQPSYFDKLPKGVAAPANPRRLLPLSHQLLTADLQAEGDVPIGRILKGQFDSSYRESSPFEEQAVIYK